MNFENYDISGLRLVHKLYSVNNRKFTDLIQLHLSLVLDVSLSEMEILVKLPNQYQVDVTLHTCNTSALPSHKKLSAFKRQFRSRSFTREDSSVNSVCGTDIFGKPLTQEGIALVCQLATFLQLKDNINSEGLFRKSGSPSRQNELRRILSMGDTVDLLSHKFSCHDGAFVFKSFLGQLPQPLICDEQSVAYGQISNFVHLDEMSRVEQLRMRNKQITAIQLLNILLPPENYQLLKLLLQFLHDVSDHKDQNKMDVSNLGTIFGPIVLGSRVVNPAQSASDALHANSKLCSLFSMMIEKCNLLFELPVLFLQDIKCCFENTSNSETNTSSVAKVESFGGVKTKVHFVDRDSSEQSEEKFGTENSLAELFAYVQQMPDGSQKRRLVKQFRNHNRDNIETESRKTPKLSALKKFQFGRKRNAVTKVSPRRRSLGLSVMSLNSTSTRRSSRSSLSSSNLATPMASSSYFGTDDVTPDLGESKFGHRLSFGVSTINSTKKCLLNDNSDVIMNSFDCGIPDADLNLSQVEDF